MLQSEIGFLLQLFLDRIASLDSALTRSLSAIRAVMMRVAVLLHSRTAAGITFLSDFIKAAVEPGFSGLRWHRPQS
jgi:hypothetical protein